MTAVAFSSRQVKKQHGPLSDIRYTQRTEQKETGGSLVQELKKALISAEVSMFLFPPGRNPSGLPRVIHESGTL